MSQNSLPDHDQNQLAFRKMKATIDRSYPKGRFLAIEKDRIVADGASFQELATTLNSMGMNSKETLVVQAGEEYPETGVILAQFLTK